MDISDLDLPPLARKFCRMACIETVEELIKLTEPQILKYRALGKPSLPDFQKALKALGLELGMKTSAEYRNEAEELEARGKAMLAQARKLRKMAANIDKLA